jgi:hypothetical protein
MEEIDISLKLLINVQGDIKRCREAASRISDRNVAEKLYRAAVDMERQVRELDRLCVGGQLGRIKEAALGAYARNRT